MTNPPLCQFLEWDTDFFGRRIARVVPTRLTPSTTGEVLAWCESEQIDCLYFLAESTDQESVILAEDHGFRQVDIRMVLERSLGDVTPAEHLPVPVRNAADEDIPALRTIAGASYRDSRFYYDSHFPTALCDALYETWVERSCHGYADAVLVAAGENDQPAGFITCHLEQDTGKIGLVGVGEAARGQGVGRDLINAALIWFATQEMSGVTVVTQGRNVRAQRLYQRNGFITRSVQLWYHRWFEAK
jgi:dTDP-4-amino-4,6-dideoxy-D-galactose acyltransferase